MRRTNEVDETADVLRQSNSVFRWIAYLSTSLSNHPVSLFQKCILYCLSVLVPVFRMYERHSARDRADAMVRFIPRRAQKRGPFSGVGAVWQAGSALGEGCGRSEPVEWRGWVGRARHAPRFR